MILRVIKITTLILLWIPLVSAQSMSAYQIIEKAHKNCDINDFQAQAEMTIYRPTWERSIGIKSWGKSMDMAMILIVSPPKEKGQAFLKRDENIWSWQPAIERTVKIAASATSTSWMGSDFTFDDMLNISSFLHDFNYDLSGEEKIYGDLCYKLLLTATPESVTVWSKLIIWISKTSFVERKIEYYDENDVLIRTMISSNIETYKGHHVPLHVEVIPADKEGCKTVVKILDYAIDPSIKESFFSMQNMKRLN